MVLATSLDLFMPSAAESVNNKIQIKRGGKKSPPLVDQPRYSTDPMMPPPPD